MGEKQNEEKKMDRLGYTEILFSTHVRKISTR
jgi:hypothetical protein